MQPTPSDYAILESKCNAMKDHIAFLEKRVKAQRAQISELAAVNKELASMLASELEHGDELFVALAKENKS